jgi:flagellar protein FliJ
MLGCKLRRRADRRPYGSLITRVIAHGFTWFLHLIGPQLRMSNPYMQPIITLLELAERERDAALALQQRAEQALQVARQQADQLAAYRSDCARRWSQRFRGGSAMEIVNCYQGFVSRLDDAVGLQGGAVDRAQEQVRHCQAQTLAAELRAASVRKLIERREAGLLQNAQRSEQKMFDEMASRAAWNRLAAAQTFI